MSNSSISRVSIASGSFRVTITSGFLLGTCRHVGFGTGLARQGMTARLAIQSAPCPAKAPAAIYLAWQKSTSFSSGCRSMREDSRVYRRRWESDRSVSALGKLRQPWRPFVGLLLHCRAVAPMQTGDKSADRPAEEGLGPAHSAFCLAAGPTRSMSAPAPAPAIRSTGCSSARQCRSRSWPSTKTGGKYAIGRGQAAGSTRAC